MSNARFGLRVRNGLVRGITEGLASLDSDALAFITAAGITDTTQYNAIVKLVVDLKTYGLWTKMKAIYPFVGGTASTHKWNLKDPRDLDVAFRLVFNGGWTHSTNGATPNGTNAFANTYFNPSLNITINSGHISIYSRTISSQIADQPARAFDGTNDMQISPNINISGFSFVAMVGGSEVAVASNTDCRGLFLSTRTANNSLKGFKNTSTLATNTTIATHTYPNANLFLGAANASGSPANYSILQQSFASIGDGLTDTEAANLYTAVQTFQTTLSRNV